MFFSSNIEEIKNETSVIIENTLLEDKTKKSKNYLKEKSKNYFLYGIGNSLFLGSILYLNKDLFIKLYKKQFFYFLSASTIMLPLSYKFYQDIKVENSIYVYSIKNEGENN